MYFLQQPAFKGVNFFTTIIKDIYIFYYIILLPALESINYLLGMCEIDDRNWKGSTFQLSNN